MCPWSVFQREADKRRKRPKAFTASAAVVSKTDRLPPQRRIAVDRLGTLPEKGVIADLPAVVMEREGSIQNGQDAL